MPRYFGRSGQSWSRFSIFIVYLGVFAALASAWIRSLPLIFEGAPYEAWDECMGYTEASALSLKQHFQNATYGSIEEFKFRIAKFVYKQFDPVGKQLSPRRWSNNVLRSYLQPSAIFDVPTFDGTYSRGILDRRPFIIARLVNMIGGLILASILCCFWLMRYRYQGLFLIVPLLWFFISSGYLSEAVNVTPNAWNSLLAVAVFVCLFDVIERRRAIGLYIASGLAALGANAKVDFLFVSLPILLTWIIADLGVRTFRQRWLMPALFCVVSFLGMLVLTNPRLLYAGPLVIGEQCRVLSDVRSATADAGFSGIGYNGVQLIRNFLTDCLGVPWKLVRPHFFRATVLGAVCLFFPLVVIFSSGLDHRRKRLILILLTSFYVFLWLMPMFFAGKAYGRYFLSGSAVVMISVGYACRYLWRENLRFGRLLAALVLCVCGFYCFDQAKGVGRRANLVQARIQEGLDQMMTRNQAVLEIIKLIKSGKYCNQVVIDQHSYTDVHAFLEKGISVVLINLFNYQQELKRVETADKPTLVLYVPGKSEASESWEGKWDNEEQSRYETYLKCLSGFSTVAQFGGEPMLLLDWAPVNPSDKVVICQVEPELDKAQQRESD